MTPTNDYFAHSTMLIISRIILCKYTTVTRILKERRFIIRVIKVTLVHRDYPNPTNEQRACMDSMINELSLNLVEYGYWINSRLYQCREQPVGLTL